MHLVLIKDRVFLLFRGIFAHFVSDFAETYMLFVW